mmetsp:Transcript_6318/g.6528  ORF Transcript_6318/g.6528 Transcript_6318/m.6528 type:complete len:124 (-) Transcript_6318:8-379(-)
MVSFINYCFSIAVISFFCALQITSKNIVDLALNSTENNEVDSRRRRALSSPVFLYIILTFVFLILLCLMMNVAEWLGISKYFNLCRRQISTREIPRGPPTEKDSLSECNSEIVGDSSDQIVME